MQKQKATQIKLLTGRYKREMMWGYLFILPWIIGYLIFTMYPVFYSLFLSFQEAYYHAEKGITTTFVGIENYLSVFRNQYVLPLYVDYLGRILLSVPLIIVFAMIISILINQPIKGKGIWRTIFFLPVVISTGPVITELALQGATSLPSFEESSAIDFLGNTLGWWIATPVENMMQSLLLILWFAGIPILIFLAALQKTDKEVYEAAAIDGASNWDTFWKITLPSLMPFVSVNIIYVVVTMSLSTGLSGVLEEARGHILNGGADSNRYHGFGYGASVTWIYFLIMVLVILVFVGLVTLGGRRYNRGRKLEKRRFKKAIAKIQK